MSTATNESQGYGAGAGLSVNGVNLDNDLLTGKAGGQTIQGGTGSTDNLTIRASSAVSPTGKVRIGSSAIAALTVVEGGTNGQNLVGINQESPNGQLEVKSTGNCTALFVNGGGGSVSSLRVCVAAFTGALLTARSTAGTLGGVTSAGAALLFDGGIGAGVVGTTTAHDQVFVVAGTEGFRLDQTSKQMKFPATSITANGSGAITAPGSIAPVAVSVQEWLTFKNAAGATRYMQMWG